MYFMCIMLVDMLFCCISSNPGGAYRSQHSRHFPLTPHLVSIVDITD